MTDPARYRRRASDRAEERARPAERLGDVAGFVVASAQAEAAHGGTLTRLATGLLDGLQLAWSPDGTTIAVITGTERVVGTVTWLIPATGDTPRRLALDHDASLSAVAWSPDGTRLAGLIDRTDLDTLDFRFQPVVIRSRMSITALELHKRPHGSTGERCHDHPERNCALYRTGLRRSRLRTGACRHLRRRAHSDHWSTRP
jgi:hypothetical protein